MLIYLYGTNRSWDHCSTSGEVQILHDQKNFEELNAKQVSQQCIIMTSCKNYAENEQKSTPIARDWASISHIWKSCPNQDGKCYFMLPTVRIWVHQTSINFQSWKKLYVDVVSLLWRSFLPPLPEPIDKWIEVMEWSIVKRNCKNNLESKQKIMSIIYEMTLVSMPLMELKIYTCAWKLFKKILTFFFN